MKKSLVVLIFFGILIVTIFSFFPRTPVINLLKVETGIPNHPDLIAVLGGGITRKGVLGNSTRERLDAVLAFIHREKLKIPILVQEYPSGRKKMIAYLISNGIESDRILVSGFHYSEERGGTENNVEEIFYLLKTHSGIKKVLLVTSPYHQKRVHLMLGEKARRLKNSDIYFYFLQLRDDGEISRCSRWRFWHLVLHETFGIFFQRLKE